MNSSAPQLSFLTPAEKTETLISFYKRTQPGGPGWRKIVEEAKQRDIDLTSGEGKWTVPSGVLAMVLGCVFVYGAMFATGNWIYGNYELAGGLSVVVVIAAWLLKKVWDTIKGDIL